MYSGGVFREVFFQPLCRRKAKLPLLLLENTVAFEEARE
jgi:hypothetical protein